MNKKLLAIAIGSAMVAASAAAMADATVYGKIHMSIDSLDNGASGTVPSAGTTNDGIYVSSNSSRLGIKGDADLDGGLKAIYKYEMSTDYSTASNVNGNRNAYLGLKGGFGTVLAGRHDTPFKTIGRKNDLFGDTIADARNLTNDGGNDARVDNVLVYMNKFGAVDVALAYVPEDGTKDAGGNSFSLGFTQGPLKLAASMQSMSGGNYGATSEDTSATRVTAAYKMGDMGFRALWQSESDMKGVKGSDGDTMGVGAYFKSGMNKFKLQYTTRSNDVASGAPKDDGTMIALGVDHKMGKKTSVYAVYATMSNDDGSNFGLGGSGHDKNSRPAPAATEDYSGFSIGMIHKF
jgi:predicted porin